MFSILKTIIVVSMIGTLSHYRFQQLPLAITNYLDKCLTEVVSEYITDHQFLIISFPANFSHENVSTIMDKFLNEYGSTETEYLQWKSYHNAASLLIVIESCFPSPQIANSSRYQYIYVLLDVQISFQRLFEICKYLEFETNLGSIRRLPSRGEYKGFEFYNAISTGNWTFAIINKCSDVKMLTKAYTENTCINQNSITVGYVNDPPYVIKDDGENYGWRKDNLHGLAISIIKAIAKRLKLKMIYIQCTDPGRVYPNDTITGNLLLLKNASIDVALGMYAPSVSKARNFDIDQIYFYDYYVWCLSRSPPKRLNVLGSLTKIWKTIIIVLTFYIAMTVVIWATNKKTMSESKELEHYSFVVFHLFQVMLGFSTKRKPRTPWIRFMFMCIVIMGFFNSIIYQSFLVSILTTNAPKKEYVTTNDIKRNNLSISFSRTTCNTLVEEPHNFWKKWNLCSSDISCVKMAAWNKEHAAYVSRFSADYLKNRILTKSGESVVYQFDDRALPVTLLLRKGHPLGPRIKRIIGRILNAGLMKKWKDDVMRNSHFNTIIDVVEEDVNEVKVIGWKEMSFLFQMLVLMYIVAAIIFVIEKVIVWHN